MSKKFFIAVDPDKSIRFVILGIGRTEAEAISHAVSGVGGDVSADLFVAEPCTEALYNEVRDHGTPASWDFDEETGLHTTEAEANVQVFTVFGDGQKQGSARTATPEQALREVLTNFGTVISIDDTYFVDTHINSSLSEYEVYEGEFDEEPENIMPLRYDVKINFAC